MNENEKTANAPLATESTAQSDYSVLSKYERLLLEGRRALTAESDDYPSDSQGQVVAEASVADRNEA